MIVLCIIIAIKHDLVSHKIQFLQTSKKNNVGLNPTFLNTLPIARNFFKTPLVSFYLNYHLSLTQNLTRNYYLPNYNNKDIYVTSNLFWFKSSYLIWYLIATNTTSALIGQNCTIKFFVFLLGDCKQTFLSPQTHVNC